MCCEIVKEITMEEKKTFEQSIKELEEIVRRLENGDASLDESLTLFESGVKLAKSCQKMLDEAELKVMELTANPNGGVDEKEFTENKDKGI